MKTTLKKAIQITMVCVMMIVTVVVTKNTAKKIKYLYSTERMSTNGVNSFFDVIY